MKKFLRILACTILVLPMAFMMVGCKKDKTPVDNSAVKVNGKGYTDLSLAINDCSGGETVSILKDIELSSALVLDVNLKIEGNNHSIKANGLSGETFITVHADLTINNLTINANASDTNFVRAMLIDAETNDKTLNVNMTNCKLENSIWNEKSSASALQLNKRVLLNLKNTTFENNINKEEDYTAVGDMFVSSKSYVEVNGGSIGNVFVNTDKDREANSGIVLKKGNISSIYLELCLVDGTTLGGKFQRDKDTGMPTLKIAILNKEGEYVPGNCKLVPCDYDTPYSGGIA